MCGINGIAIPSKHRREVDTGLLARMRDVLEHRGPDDAGMLVERNIGLGHRRLSIVDVAHGHQPMSSGDGRVSIVYNGEIYNHRDYRNELEADGYEFATNCDTEAIIYLYRKYGRDCVEHLRGMFAFAIWDRDKNSLFIARDRLGIKPLYYVHKEDGTLYFASEIKSLIEAGAVRAELNHAVLADQLANHGTSADETLYAGVKRLLPGHTMKWADGRLEINRYWDISYEPKEHHENEQEFVDEWLAEFRKSVELRLMADVPLGMFLSGGIDSSAICALMSEMVDEPIKTFSVGFKESEANEFEYARTVARAYDTEHHEITVTEDEFFTELPRLIYHEDEPLGFVASVPLYFVSKLAREHVTVVLTGEGSDEIMAGYGRYRKALQLLNFGKKYESIAPQALRNLVKSGVYTLSGGIGRKLERTFLTREADVENLFFDNFAVFPKSLQTRLFTAEAKGRIGDLDPYAGLNKWFEASDADELLDRLLYVDSKTYLQELLMKQDQMSMAASIESRVPFLDHVLVKKTARMPVDLKLRGKTTKWILREAMRGVLPDVILDRPKMGFPVPVGRWFRSTHKHLIEEFVVGERTLSRGIFEPDVVRQLVSEHNAGADHELRLFFLLNFEIWQRQALEGEKVELS
ncbi:MAG: asparagine synthase (glutamine-hydrolyzing) [Pyrinomonadaceae bacterium]